MGTVEQANARAKKLREVAEALFYGEEFIGSNKVMRDAADALETDEKTFELLRDYIAELELKLRDAGIGLPAMREDVVLAVTKNLKVT